MKNTVFIIVLLIFSFSTFSQDTTINKYRESNLRIGLLTNLALIPQRTLFFPKEILKTDFYKEHFGLVTPTEKFDEATATFQLGGNFAWIIYSISKKTEFEFGIHTGYQNSGKIYRKIHKNFISPDTNYTVASIGIDYKLHELFTDGYFLIKSNNNFIDLFIGLGISYYGSIGSADVTFTLLENEIENYSTSFDSYSNFNPYIPLGLEFPLGKNKDDFYMKLIGSIRREVNPDNYRPNRVFLTGGFQIQYQF